ncbi:holin [Acinetobacter phage AIIMS-AbE5-RC]|uniref:Holin n=1 Tax=Acinetobacter phage AIIMS-AbE5-RC TaxID=2981552 RepID=A0A9X9JRL4_9CAUD|nr:holin [Acinetobacter phage AIIMS-AbE5-RC]
MNIVDQVYFGLVYLWSSLDKLILGAAATSFVVALLRTKKEDNKFSFIEALLCGIFTAIALVGMSFLGTLTGIIVPATLTAGAAHVVAGFIGWYGTVRTMEYLEGKVSNDSD